MCVLNPILQVIRKDPLLAPGALSATLAIPRKGLPCCMSRTALLVELHSGMAGQTLTCNICP